MDFSVSTPIGLCPGVFLMVVTHVSGSNEAVLKKNIEIMKKPVTFWPLDRQKIIGILPLNNLSPPLLRGVYHAR